MTLNIKLVIIFKKEMCLINPNIGSTNARSQNNNCKTCVLLPLFLNISHFRDFNTDYIRMYIAIL